MSANAIERRFNISDLEIITKTLDEVIKEYENQKGYSLRIDNIPKVKTILDTFMKYKLRLDEYIKECQDKINPDGFRDWSVTDNELFLQSTIGIILPLEDYYILYYYLDDAKLTKNSYINNKIIALRNELAKSIAFTSSWRYLCDYGIKREIK